MQISRTVALMTLASAMLLSVTAFGAVRGSRCEPEAQAEIARLPVDAARVGAISYKAQTYSNRDGDTSVTRILAWVDLVDCTGKLVIDMTPSCAVKQAYTTDECTVEGLSNW